MDRDEFAQRLQLATTRTVDFSRRFVWNTLPAPCRHLVNLSREGAKHTVHAGETVFPEDAQRKAE